MRTSITQRLSGVLLIVLFPFLLFKKSILRWLLVGVAMLTLVACFQKYYSTGTVTNATPNFLDSLRVSQKFFILHTNLGSFAYTDLKSQGDSISGHLGTLTPVHARYLASKEGDGNRFRGKDRESVLSEVHIYSTAMTKDEAGVARVAIRDIIRLDVNTFDAKSTNRSTTWSIVGISVGLGLIVLGIITASALSNLSIDLSGGNTNSMGVGGSCPIIMVQREGKMTFDNVMYGGAIFSNLERTDHLFLTRPDVDEGGMIKVRVRSSEVETQYIDRMSLVAINHDMHGMLVADRQGRTHLLNGIQAPGMATATGNVDVTSFVTRSDDLHYAFDAPHTTAGFSTMDVEFKVSSGIEKARLYVRARADLWTDQLYLEFANRVRDGYDDFRRAMESMSPEAMMDWQLQQGIVLKVYVRSGDKWIYVDHFPLVGLEADRDLVMEIPVPAGSDQRLQVRLETAFRFWDIDQVGLNIGTDEMLTFRQIELVSAHQSNGAEILGTLSRDDADRAVLGHGEWMDLVFRDPAPSSGVAYRLDAHGYYHDDRRSPGAPWMDNMPDLRAPGAFDAFSRSRFEAYRQWVEAAAKTTTQGTQ